MRPAIEVLSPAGSPDSLIAAVRCGAAAVYLGADNFNARRAAHNFTREELREAVEYCHIRGVAVHLALNTLISDSEMPQALELAQYACEIGVDAIIVQDLGLARLLRVAAPQMPLHASTQLSCHSPSGVDFLRDVGFSRVVLSREMSRDEIAACIGRGVEIEVFVHGALCMSVSGQCYFSAMLGGRSGNRGMCAQPCRLPFSPVGCKGGDKNDSALSLKDQCLVRYMQELADMGVASVKIEGRMKRPEYVAAATAAYSRAARGIATDEETLATLRSVFSRSGFTDGYFTARRGADMFGIRRKEDVTAATDVLRSLAHTYEREVPLVDVTFDLRGDDTAVTLIATDEDGNTSTAVGDGMQIAINRPIDTVRVDEQLRKTGNTPYRVVSTQITIADGHTMPLSAINALRREALESLTDIRRQRVPIPFIYPTLECANRKPSAHPRTVVRLASEAQWSKGLNADLVILPFDTNESTLRAAVESGDVAVEIPRGMFGAEESVRTALATARKIGVTTVLCNNINGLSFVKEMSLTPIGGFGLNAYNAQAIRSLAEHGLRAATLSMEMTLPQIADISADIPLGMLVYGRQPLMLTRNCPRSSAGGSCADCQHQGIVDRTGTVFPVTCHNGCAEVLNSVPLYWLDRLNELPPVDFHLYHFTVETADEVARIINTPREQLATPPSITRGLYKRGVL